MISHETKKAIRSTIDSIRRELEESGCGYEEEAWFNLLEIDAAIDPMGNATREMTVRRLKLANKDLYREASERGSAVIAGKIKLLNDLLIELIRAEGEYKEASRKASDALNECYDVRRRLRLYVEQSGSKDVYEQRER